MKLMKLLAFVSACSSAAAVAGVGVPLFTGEFVVPGNTKTAYPSVTAHGMGDSCFNPGMQQITQIVANQTGQYAVCVPTGDDLGSDTNNGFFMTMDKNVDVFAAKVAKDPKLANGFNCIGFSQGNSVCRGYIHKYNSPPVINWLSVHGTVSGVAGFPNCNPSGLLGLVCKPLSHLCGAVSYLKISQDHLFQIDYFRDPMRVHTDAYKTNSQIAQWNGEGPGFKPEYKTNFVSVKKFAMIRAMKDSMVYPSEGEHWGHFADGSLDKKDILTMRETDWYKTDAFGLKTVDEAGKMVFNQTAGNHLQFSEEQLVWWLDNYFTE